VNEDFLGAMAHHSRERVLRAKQDVPLEKMLELAHAAAPAPALNLHRDGFDLIAELKIRSPAAGQLGAADEDVAARVQRYARAGAAAVSVLTEPSRFDGSLEHLQMATGALESARVPAMRKDFLVDPYQVLEARVAGAGGVLVILRMLHFDEINALLDAAKRLGMFVLIEAFDERDIERAHAIVDARLAQQTMAQVAVPARDQLMVGINCRDLVTLKVVPGRLEQLAHMLPSRVPRVAESGVGTAEDASRVASVGYDLALVGSALMTGGDPAALIQSMLAAGREACLVRRAHTDAQAADSEIAVPSTHGSVGASSSAPPQG
jgi:indole-3-glycerol phosphate synthase